SCSGWKIVEGRVVGVRLQPIDRPVPIDVEGELGNTWLVKTESVVRGDKRTIAVADQVLKKAVVGIAVGVVLEHSDVRLFILIETKDGAVATACKGGSSPVWKDNRSVWIWSVGVREGKAAIAGPKIDRNYRCLVVGWIIGLRVAASYQVWYAVIVHISERRRIGVAEDLQRRLERTIAVAQRLINIIRGVRHGVFVDVGKDIQLAVPIEIANIEADGAPSFASSERSTSRCPEGSVAVPEIRI